MSGIYIHIPFCRKACTYCDFHFSTVFKLKDELLAAVHKEISLQQRFLADSTVQTIYFGGGTPSILEITEVEKLLTQLHNCFPVSSSAEITFEANPDDLSVEYLKELFGLGVNRLSIGVQSLSDDYLQWMNRTHSTNDAMNSIHNARNIGFENINVDLIYGLPDLQDDVWQSEITNCIKAGITHLSTYNLTVEPKTILHHQVKTNRVRMPADDHIRRQYYILMTILEQHGWEHYEISNSCKAGYRSRHNSSYWKRQKYLGIGPSAHSFDGVVRYWNIANNKKYINSISMNQLPSEEERLSAIDQINETLLTGLRTKWGCDQQEIEQWGQVNPELLESMSLMVDAGYVEINNGCYVLTFEGQLMADFVARELFLLQN